MDRLESMSVLVAVVEAGSFSAAGRQMHMPVPTVSRKVAELESHLKAKLLLRSTRKLTLTEAGKSYVATCKRILEDVAAAERGASGEFRAPIGELVVTAPVVLGRLHLVPVVAEFLSVYPDVNVRLVLTDRALNLVDDHVDLAVRIGELPDSRLIATRIGQVRHVVCASPGYFERHAEPLTPDDLARHQCVTFTALSGSEAWAFRTDRGIRSIRVRSRLVVNTAEAAIDAATAATGLTRVLSYQVAELIKKRQLVTVLKNFEPEPLPVNLVYTGDLVFALKLRAFLDFATPRLRRRLSEKPRRL